MGWGLPVLHATAQCASCLCEWRGAGAHLPAHDIHPARYQLVEDAGCMDRRKPAGSSKRVAGEQLLVG